MCVHNLYIWHNRNAKGCHDRAQSFNKLHMVRKESLFGRRRRSNHTAIQQHFL